MNRTAGHKHFLTLGLAAFGLLAAACMGDASDAASNMAGPKVIAVLKEFTIEPDKTIITAAGSISFEGQNKGTTPHELKIVKTDLAPGALPVKEGKVDEAAVQVVGKTSEFAAGKNETVTAKLAAGQYVLICNVVAHYPAGMHKAFIVTGGGDGM